jgi:gas vesicle protein
MIDVNKITSTLAKLPDQQLQQYAQMHKSDPYIMALAMSESNRRKEMRSAGQGAQGMQEQPKVVDQMVAEMAPQQLPEDQGIGQLPAGNMNFAGGGIIAFADGGDVERYQYGGMPPRSIMGDIPGFVAGTGNLIPQQGAPEEVPLFRRMFRDARAVGANYQLEQAKARIAAGVGTSADEAIIAAAQPAQSTAPSPQDMAQFDAASNLYMTERAAKQAAAPKAPDAAPKVDPTRRSGTGTGAASAAAAGTKQPPQAGLDDLIQKYQRQTDLNIGQARNATAQYAKELEDEGTQLVASEKKRIAEKVDPYKDREARLLKQEKDSEGMGDKYLGLALLQAGAAMMTTPGGIGMALGKGVQVGSDRYIAGIEKINAAKEKFALAKDRLEDLRINRADMNERDVRDAEKEARSLNRQGKSLFYSGAKDELNMKDKQITAVLGLAADDLKTTRQIDAERQNTLTREAGANARNRNTQLEVLEAVSKDPRLAAAYQSMHGKGEDVMGQYNDFLKANPILAQDPQQAVTQFLMTKSVFSQIGKPTVTDKPSTNVRTQP